MTTVGLVARPLRCAPGRCADRGHILRHTLLAFGDAEEPMRAVQELGGHGGQAMTTRYSHLSPAASDTTVPPKRLKRYLPVAGAGERHSRSLALVLPVALRRHLGPRCQGAAFLK